MKKAIMILAAALLLASCSGATGGTSPAPAEEFFFRAPGAGIEVRINDDMSEALAALGEPLKYFEAASCAFTGLDKTYTYSGFVITTRPEGERDLISSIRLTDDSAATPEGVYIGCGAARVKSAYPSSSATDNVVRAEKGGTALNIIMKDGAVISIEYLPA